MRPLFPIAMVALLACGKPPSDTGSDPTSTGSVTSPGPASGSPSGTASPGTTTGNPTGTPVGTTVGTPGGTPTGTTVGTPTGTTTTSPPTCVLTGAVGGAQDAVQHISGSGSQLDITLQAGTQGSITSSPNLSFSGSATTPTCLWAVSTTPSTIAFVDFAGAPVGPLTVTGATVSGSVTPPCTPTPYGCFPPCLSSVSGGTGQLTLTYTDGFTGTLDFTCP